MIRALAKGAALWGFGRAPGGEHAYRWLTRNQLGTYATHVDKLARVWPGYARLWRDRCGLPLDGARLLVLDGGETPFVPFASFLLTGAGGVVVNRDAGMLPRYLARARTGVLAAPWDADQAPSVRRQRLEGLRWEPSLAAALAAVDGRVLIDAHRLPVPAASIDLVHSGGALEHYPPDELDAILAEMRRVVRPGGIVSHVVDHRDHLHHADNRYPFLAHLALPDPLYRAAFGHGLGFHNRLSPTAVHARLVAAGLEPIALRRLVYAGGERRWVDDDASALAGAPGLPPARLAAAFRDLSPADLRTAAAHYLFRRP